MAKSTANLGLYEVESTDSKNTFNIQTMLNDNFDKIDADSKSKQDAIDNINNGTGVPSGTYKSVTVDTKGRVTGGTNPTTLSGYGITDAYTKTDIDSKSTFNRIDITGQTLDLNSLVLSSSSPTMKYYIQKTSDGSANISNMPVTNTDFILDVELIRYVSNADYILKQTFVSGVQESTYQRFYNNLVGANTWSPWVKLTNKSEIDAELDAHINDTTKHTGTATTTNSGNAYSVTIPNVSSLSDMLEIRVKFNSASSGAITLNVNSLGAKNVVDYFGNAVTNVRQYLIANLCYEASTGNFILLGKGGGGSAQAAHLLSGETATVDSGPISGTMINRPNGQTATNTYAWNNGSTRQLAVRIPLGAYLTDSAANPNVSEIQCVENNLVSANIKSGTSIFGVAGKSSVVDTADATAGVGQIRSGQSAYVNGNKITGSCPVQATGAQTVIPGTSDIVKPAGIYDGAITIKGIQPSNIGGRNYYSGNISSQDTNSHHTQIYLPRVSFTPKIILISASSDPKGNSYSYCIAKYDADNVVLPLGYNWQGVSTSSVNNNNFSTIGGSITASQIIMPIMSNIYSGSATWYDIKYVIIG